MERVAMDILGPLPVSNRGNKYILVVGDYFSKWTEGYAIPNQEAATVARMFVEEFVCRYAVPLQVHTDQGRNFEAELFQQMCKHLGADKTRTAAFNPQNDGMIERFNRTLENLLAKNTQQQQQQQFQTIRRTVMNAYLSLWWPTDPPPTNRPDSHQQNSWWGENNTLFICIFMCDWKLWWTSCK